MESERSSWAEMKHEPAQRTNVLNPIRNIIEREFNIPLNPPVPLLNLCLGNNIYKVLIKEYR